MKRNAVPIIGLSLFVLFAALAVAGPAFGQVLLTPGHEDGRYAAGEPIVWTVAQAPDSKTESVRYAVRKHGVGDPIQEDTLDLTSGPAKIEVTLDEPGSVFLTVNRVAVSPEDRGNQGRARNVLARDGALVDAERIQPSLPRPEDFDAWWGEKLALLDEVPPNAELEPGDSGVEGVAYYKVDLDNVGGTHVRGQLAKPAGAGKYPAILQLQWAGVYPLQQGWATGWAKHGFLTLNVLAHDMPIDDEAAVRARAEGDLRNYPAIGNTSRETSYFLRMYLGDCQALKYLASHPDWDGKTLIVMGDSMGGQQSFATVGLVGEKYGVTHMICNVPAGCDVGARSTSRRMAYPNWPDTPEILGCSRYFDPVNFASRIKATSLISFGLFDGTSPPTGILAAFNQLQGAKELVPMHSDHGGPGHEPRAERREAWLTALNSGNAVEVRE